MSHRLAQAHTDVNSEHAYMCVVYPLCIGSVGSYLQKFLTKRRQTWPSNSGVDVCFGLFC